jgi:hypothetical protein
VPIALGSDWIVTGSMNLLRGLRCADEFNSNHLGVYFSDFQLWQMVTTNAAFAAGVVKGLGMLKPNYLADPAIFDARDDTDHRAVVHADLEDVLLTVRGGKVLYRNADLVTALAPSCDAPVEICGVLKRACTTSDTGHAFTEIQQGIDPIYNLVQCGTPLDEPTCVPSRPGEYPIGGADADGDGIGVSVDLRGVRTVVHAVHPGVAVEIVRVRRGARAGDARKSERLGRRPKGQRLRRDVVRPESEFHPLPDRDQGGSQSS